MRFYSTCPQAARSGRLHYVASLALITLALLLPAAVLSQAEPDATPPAAATAAVDPLSEELDELISAWTRTIPAERLEQLMDEFGIPSGKIYRAPEMLADPHFQARHAIVSTSHPKFGELQMQNVAPKLSLTPGNIRGPAPALGEHNEEVYQDVLGFSRERLAELKASGII